MPPHRLPIDTMYHVHFHHDQYQIKWTQMPPMCCPMAVARSDVWVCVVLLMYRCWMYINVPPYILSPYIPPCVFSSCCFLCRVYTYIHTHPIHTHPVHTYNSHITYTHITYTTHTHTLYINTHQQVDLDDLRDTTRSSVSAIDPLAAVVGSVCHTDILLYYACIHGVVMILYACTVMIPYMYTVMIPYMYTVMIPYMYTVFLQCYSIMNSLCFAVCVTGCCSPNSLSYTHTYSPPYTHSNRQRTPHHQPPPPLILPPAPHRNQDGSDGGP